MGATNSDNHLQHHTHVIFADMLYTDLLLKSDDALIKGYACDGKSDWLVLAENWLRFLRLCLQ